MTAKQFLYSVRDEQKEIEVDKLRAIVRKYRAAERGRRTDR